ncbi:MAG: TonB-dependent receptor plug domain-containing protein [Opitutaceae bacterium]
MKTLAGFTARLCLAAAGFGQMAAQTTSPAPASDSGADKDRVITLDAFKVAAGGESGYGVSTATSATRLNTPLKDIPQTLNVVTGQFLKDTFSYTLTDAVRYVPNVKKRSSTHQPNNLIVRGFIVDASFVDGFRISETSRDLANVERIEIIKGPASATIGRGEVGGAVNFITKRPQKQRSSVVETVLGSDNFRRVVADTTGPLNTDGSLRYRAIASYQEDDGYRLFEQTRSLAFFPSFEWDVSAKTQLALSADLGKFRIPGRAANAYLTSRTPGNPPGLPEGPTRREFDMGEHWDRRYDDLGNVLLALTHQFNEHLVFRQGALFGSRKREVYWADPSPRATFAANGDILINRQYLNYNDTRHQWALQGELVAQYDFLGGHHMTLVGYELNGYHYNALNLIGALTPINYTNPVYGALPTNVRDNSSDYFEAENAGFPFQHQASFFSGALKVMAGVRLDEGRSYRHYKVVVRPDEKNDWGAYTASPRYGITVSPKDWISFYGVISKDTQETTVSNRYDLLPLTDPRMQEKLVGARNGELKEAGVKAEVLGGRLSVTASWYEISRINQRVNIIRVGPDGSAYNEFFLTDGEQVKGVEVQVFGRIADRLNLVASFADTQTANKLASGTFFIPSVPTNEYSAFLSYDFHAPDQDGFSIRGGYIRVGEMWGTSDNLFRFGSQSKADFGVSYTWGPRRFDFQVNNAFNDRFIQAAPVSQVLSETPPRQIYASFRWSF